MTRTTWQEGRLLKSRWGEPPATTTEFQIGRTGAEVDIDLFYLLQWNFGIVKRKLAQNENNEWRFTKSQRNNRDIHPVAKFDIDDGKCYFYLQNNNHFDDIKFINFLLPKLSNNFLVFFDVIQGSERQKERQ